eukprot:UN02274
MFQLFFLFVYFVFFLFFFFLLLPCYQSYNHQQVSDYIRPPCHPYLLLSQPFTVEITNIELLLSHLLLFPHLFFVIHTHTQHL